MNFFSYPDDFVITLCINKSVGEYDKTVNIRVPEKRGLSLSIEKKMITHISKRFGFLGFNIRKHKEKLLIKLIKYNMLMFIRNTKEIIKSLPDKITGELIKILSPKL